LWQRGQARFARDQALDALRTQSRMLTDNSAAELQKGDAVSAALLAFEGLPDATATNAVRRDWPHVAELERHVFNELLNQNEQSLVAVRKGVNTHLELSKDSSRLIIDGNLHDGETGKPIKTLVPAEAGTVTVPTIFFAKGGVWVVYVANGVARIAGAQDGADLPGLLRVSDNISRIFVDEAADAAVTVHKDGSVRLQRFGEEPKVIRPPAAGERSPPDITWRSTVVFDSESRVFVLTPGDHTAELYSLATGERLRAIIEPVEIRGAVFDPAGKRFLTLPATNRRTGRDVVAHLYAAGTGELLQKFAGHTEGLWDAAFSPDGSRVVTGSEDNSARIFDIASGTAMATMARHKTDVVKVQYVGRQRTRILTKGADGNALEDEDVQLRLWDADGGLITEFPAGGRFVSASALSPDERELAICGTQRRIQIWSMEDGSAQYALNGHRSYVRRMVYANGGARLISVSDDGTLRFWRARRLAQSVARFADPTRSPSRSDYLPYRPAQIMDAALDRHGKFLNTIVDDSVLRVWLQAVPQAPLRSVPLGEGTLIADVRQAVTVTVENGRVSLRDFSLDQELDALAYEGGHAALAHVRKNDGVWALGAADGAILVRDFNGRRALARLPNTARLTGIALGPQGRRLVALSKDRAQWWDVATSRSVAQVSLPAAAAHELVIDPASAWFLIVSDDSVVAIFDFDGRRVAGFRTTEPINQEARRFRPTRVAALSPRGDRVAIATGHRIELRTAATGARERTLDGHAESVVFMRDLGAIGYTTRAHVTDLAFTDDGGRLLSASDDGTARLWDAASGETVGVFSGHGSAIPALRTGPVVSSNVPEDFFFRSVTAVVPSQDGRQVVTASADGTVRIWPLVGSTQALVDGIKQKVARCLTPTQRVAYRLDPEPPEWCIDERKWPYDDPAWRAWLAARRNGEAAELPALDINENTD
jgi:WD40 repeat protein